MGELKRIRRGTDFCTQSRGESGGEGDQEVAAALRRFCSGDMEERPVRLEEEADPAAGPDGPGEGEREREGGWARPKEGERERWTGCSPRGGEDFILIFLL